MPIPPDEDLRRVSYLCAHGHHADCPGEVYRIPPEPDASPYQPCLCDSCDDHRPAKDAKAAAATRRAQRAAARRAG